MKWNNVSGKLSSKNRRRSPARRQRIARKRTIVPYGREIRSRGISVTASVVWVETVYGGFVYNEALYG